MKKYFLPLFILVLVLCTVTAYADDLSDIRNAKELIFGIAPDYVPFAFHDANGDITGLDVELVREIGRRMGVNVTVLDYAFDGMIDALNVDQVDMIGTAFAITPERQKVIDFTRTYFGGDAKFIANKTANLTKASSLADFSGLKIGVQKGTSFEQWIKVNLVEANYIPAKNVYTYTNVSDEMKALSENRIDVVLVVQDSYADLYEASGSYKIFADGFMKESYAFGLRKGSTLTEELNKHLSAMISDGTAQQIADKFFSMDYTGLESNSGRIERVEAPAAPQQQVSCTNAMSFISDVSISDGTQFKPGTLFTKTWRVKNTGTCTWTTDYSIVFTAGDHLNGQTTRMPKNVQPGDTVDISVNMAAPNANGSYNGYWQLRSQYGYNFGQTLWLKIKVDGVPQNNGQKRVVPVIKNFYASSTGGSPDQCVTVYWTTENAASIDLLVDGKQFIRTQSASGNSTICDEVRSYGDHSFELIAHTVTDDVRSSLCYETTGQYQVIPVVTSFFLNPDSGFEGECTYAHWTVDNAAGIEIYVDGNVFVQANDATGYVPVCDEVRTTGTHTFKIVAHSVTDDASATASYTTYAKQETQPEPEPYEPEPYEPEPSHEEYPDESYTDHYEEYPEEVYTDYTEEYSEDAYYEGN